MAGRARMVRRVLACCAMLVGCGAGSPPASVPGARPLRSTWVRQFGDNRTSSAKAHHIAPVADHVVVVGRVSGAIAFDAFVVDTHLGEWSNGAFFLVLDGSGRVVAARRLDGPEPFPFDVADLSSDARGSVYVVGVHHAVAGQEWYLLQRLDLSGRVLFSRSWRPHPVKGPGVVGGFGVDCVSVAAGEGAVFVGGSDNEVTFIEKRGDGGDVVWRREMKKRDGLDCPTVASDGQGGVLAAGGGPDPYVERISLARLDASGQTRWVLPFPSGLRREQPRILQFSRPTLGGRGGEILVAGAQIAAAPPARYLAQTAEQLAALPGEPVPEPFVARVSLLDGRLLEIRRAWVGAPEKDFQVSLDTAGIVTAVGRHLSYGAAPGFQVFSVLAQFGLDGAPVGLTSTPQEALQWVAAAGDGRGALIAAGQLALRADLGAGTMQRRSTTGDLVVVKQTP